jgi:uncharacterized protein with GYD domain
VKWLEQVVAPAMQERRRRLVQRFDQLWWHRAEGGRIMPTYVMLTRLTPEAAKTPGELKRLERLVADHVRKDCPQVKWIANYATLGPYDYLDIFDAPDETVAAKVVMIVRSYGHGQTETWTAMPWDRFAIILPT